MKSTVLRIVTVAASATALILCWLMITVKRPELQPAPRGDPVIPVAVVIASASERERPIVLSGEVRARQSAEIKAQVAGVVTAVAAACERGARVAEGQVLLELDPRDINVAIARADAEVERAQARARGAETELQVARELVPVIERRLELQRREHQRMSKMGEAELVASMELDRSERVLAALEQELVTQQGRVESARAALETAAADEAVATAAKAASALDLERTHVAAPFAGTVLERKIDIGDLAMRGTDLFEIADLTRVVVEARVPAHLADEVAIGAAATVELTGARAVRLPGQVARAGLTSDIRTRTVVIEVEVENPDPPVALPGSFARVEFAGKKLNSVFAIPESALVTHEDGHALFVIEGDAAHMRIVELLWREPAANETRLAVVRGAISDGESVVIGGASLLSRGAPSKVTIQ